MISEPTWSCWLYPHLDSIDLVSLFALRIVLVLFCFACFQSFHIFILLDILRSWLQSILHPHRSIHCPSEPFLRKCCPTIQYPDLPSCLDGTITSRVSNLNAYKTNIIICSQDVPLVQMPAKNTLTHGCLPLTIWKSTSLSDPVLAATPGALCFLEQSFQWIFNLLFWHSRWLESGLFPPLPCKMLRWF